MQATIPATRMTDMASIKNQNFPARHENAVVFACDYGHFPLALFAAHRVRKVEKGRFDIVIAMPDISRVAPEHMDGDVRICELDFSALPQVPMVKEWISFGTYFRWVLPDAFVGQYRSIFYLDTDTYLRRPCIERLFAGLRPDYPLCAVTELIRPPSPGSLGDQKFAEKLRDLGGRNGEYYNAGVLVMQPEPFIAMNGLSRFQEAAVKNVEFLPFHRDQDQGAMNLAFANDIVPLSPLYNWRTRDWMNPRFTREYDPAVLHFAGPLKPWDHQDNPFFKTFTKEYMKFILPRFPDFERKVPDKSAEWRRRNPKHKIKLFEEIRIALFLRRFRKKLERTWYSGDMDAKRAVMDAAIANAVVC